MLLRRNTVIDAETAQLVWAAVQAALQAGAPPGPAGAADCTAAVSEVFKSSRARR